MKLVDLSDMSRIAWSDDIASRTRSQTAGLTEQLPCIYAVTYVSSRMPPSYAVVVPESLEESIKAGACLRYARADVCVSVGIGICCRGSKSGPRPSG